MTTKLKSVEEVVNHIITLSNEKTAGYEMKIENAITQYHQDLLAVLKEGEREEWQRLADSAEMLWVCLANVNEGDWTKQTPEWQEAAKRWRDNYFGAVVKKDHSELDQPINSIIKE